MVNVEKSGRVKMTTDFNAGARLVLDLEEDGQVIISGWRGKDNRIKQFDFIKLCRDELTKFIDMLDGEVVFEDRKFYEFWKPKQLPKKGVE